MLVRQQLNWLTEFVHKLFANFRAGLCLANYALEDLFVQCHCQSLVDFRE